MLAAGVADAVDAAAATGALADFLAGDFFAVGLLIGDRRCAEDRTTCRGFKHGFPDRPNLSLRMPVAIDDHRGSQVAELSNRKNTPPPANEAHHGFGLVESQDRPA